MSLLNKCILLYFPTFTCVVGGELSSADHIGPKVAVFVISAAIVVFIQTSGLIYLQYPIYIERYLFLLT